tara:strand:- start:1877 stop:2272 length:396 start_codon:yes stop_codon:yes gene_type:complete
MVIAGMLEQIGLTGGLLAGLVLVGALFVGERRKRKAAEKRASVARKSAALADETKDAVVAAVHEKDAVVAAVDKEVAAKHEEIDREADKVDEAAALGGSALADIWNKLMGRKGERRALLRRIMRDGRKGDK